jgi:imidazolonepropionase
MTVPVPTADTLLTELEEVATMAGPPGPRRGEALGTVSRVERAAIAFDRGVITWVGRSRLASRSIRLRPGARRFELSGAVALPGLVDAHTHAIFAGSRWEEQELKARGFTYSEIARSGGGLLKTVQQTREADDRRLRQETKDRLRRCLAWGTTALEIKSGYGLDLAHELRLLKLVPRLSRETGLTLVPTFLGAHAVPPGLSRREYLHDLIHRQIPQVARRGLARYNDVFCDEGYFSVPEAKRILRAGIEVGLAPKIHAEELGRTGASLLASALPAVSADHLLHCEPSDMEALSRAGVVGVILPGTALSTGGQRRPPGRELADAGVAVALGTDLSPTSWIEALPVVVGLSVPWARLTPCEALVAATVNAAWAIGLGGRAGEVLPGREADVVVFPASRVEEIPYRFGLRPPSHVFRKGRWVASEGRWKVLFEGRRRGGRGPFPEMTRI